MTTKIVWLKARCACGKEYEYIEGGYKPKTCGRFECVKRHLHPELAPINTGKEE